MQVNVSERKLEPEASMKKVLKHKIHRTTLQYDLGKQ